MNPIIAIAASGLIIVIAVLVTLRRTRTSQRAMTVVVASGVATGVLAGLYGFTVASMPIAPYERATASFWLQLVTSLAALAVIGFSAGVLLASAVLVPAQAVLGALRRGLPTSVQGKPPSPPKGAP